MAESSSRGYKRKCPRMLKKDSTVCLSDLPDAILIHILSFLPTKSLVSTSLLSRRWRYLWSSTPNLELHEYEFKYDHDKFMNFADRALVLRGGSSLVSFSLTCRVENDESRINTWITSAIQRNVEQLTLKLWGYEDSFILSSCIFGCQSLVKLDLQMNCCIRVPSMICLPRLKHLSLEWVKFVDNESAEKLLSHPLLEELILCDCSWHNIMTVNVNSPKLQSLSIKDWSEEDWSEEGQLCFIGDNLKFFSYEGFLPPTQYYICGLTMQLREAVVLVRYHDHEVLDMGGPSNRYCKLLNSLSGVQNLMLSEDTAQSLYLLNQCPLLQTTLPVFDQLGRLTLRSRFETGEISLDSVCLKMLYKRCPHLEHLNLMDMINVNFTAPVLRPMPLCFRTHLKKVTLKIYEDESDDESANHVINRRCYEDGFNLLFNSAPVLEEVVIHWERYAYMSGQVSTVEKVERELNAWPKVSENCRVSVVLVETL